MLANPRQTADDLAEWIRRYFEENGPKCSAVVGLSGGKDSTVTAALCVKALGAGRVVGVLMPDGVQADIEDAREIARVLGIRTVEVNIHAAVEGLRGALEASPGLLELSGTDGLTRDAAINMPARIRMTTLYAVGQMLPQGGRVANTCNLSEDWVGYSTKYGDAAGDFSPCGSARRTFSCTRFARSAMRSDCPGRSSTRRPRTVSRARPTRIASASPTPCSTATYSRASVPTRSSGPASTGSTP